MAAELNIFMQLQFNYFCTNGNISRGPEALLIYYCCVSVNLSLSWEIQRGELDLWCKQESSHLSRCFKMASFVFSTNQKKICEVNPELC